MTGDRRTVLVVDALTVRFPRFRLGPLSLTLSAGECLAVVGPNGSGKTTLLNRIAAQAEAFEGSIRLLGTALQGDLARFRADVGYVPDEFVGFGWMSVDEHLRFLAEFYPRWDAERAARLCETLEVDRGARLATLSRGTRVKLAFVGAEAYAPRLTILDEPTAGLDPVVRKRFLEFVGGSFRSDGDRALVFSTHILEDIEHIASRVVTLREGQVVADVPVSRTTPGEPRLAASVLASLGE